MTFNADFFLVHSIVDLCRQFPFLVFAIQILIISQLYQFCSIVWTEPKDFRKKYVKLFFPVFLLFPIPRFVFPSSTIFFRDIQESIL